MWLITDPVTDVTGALSKQLPASCRQLLAQFLNVCVNCRRQHVSMRLEAESSMAALVPETKERATCSWSWQDQVVPKLPDTNGKRESKPTIFLVVEIRNSDSI